MRGSTREKALTTSGWAQTSTAPVRPPESSTTSTRHSDGGASDWSLRDGALASPPLGPQPPRTSNRPAARSALLHLLILQVMRRSHVNYTRNSIEASAHAASSHEAEGSAPGM